MKYIVIGLGYFGGTLAANLTSEGHEVIGIDNRSEKIDELKDTISIVMEMDATNQNALKSLPLQDVDAVIVAIGEDIGSSVLALSILQNLKVERIIGRAITPQHRHILKQLGIDEIVQPEEDSALLVSSMLQIKYAKRVMELNSENAIAEILVPERYIGHSLNSVNIKGRFNLNTITVKIFPEGKRIDRNTDSDCEIDYTIDFDRPLTETDILVVTGKNMNIKKFTES
ncbi:MAG: TrkA family potassium uptake protein [Prolixibacteraceae bacterium]|jgi:trk system potassium uptake protein TrkA